MDDNKLNAALSAWAGWQAGDDAAIARIIRHADALPAMPSAAGGMPRRWWMVGAGGALAASLALGMLLLSPAPEPDATAGTASDSSASFAMLYTPTTEEEYLL